MPPVPVLGPREVVRVFESLGWTRARQRGSHIILVHPESVATLSIPNHKEIARGTLRSLIRDARITVEEFVDALRRI